MVRLVIWDAIAPMMTSLKYITLWLSWLLLGSQLLFIVYDTDIMYLRMLTVSSWMWFVHVHVLRLLKYK